MFNAQINEMLIQGVKDTLYMTLGSTALGYAIGLPMGITLAVTDKDGLKPNAFIYRIFDLIANVVRSIPFLILLIIMIPVTRAIVGKSYGASATIIPLVATAAPYIARLVESSLKEVDTGVIEAARAMGASNLNIIFRVLLVEARTSLIMGATIATGTILGYSAMAGAVGGGGRYDRLVEFLGGRPTFGVGFAIGIERLMEILSLKEAKKERDGVYICAMDEKYIDKVFALGQELRKFIKTEISYEAKNLAKHLKNADAKEAKIFLCMGENEAQKGELWCKNLVTKQEKMVKLSNIKTEIESA